MNITSKYFKSAFFLFFAGVILVAGCATKSKKIDASADSIQAGMAEIDITPPLGYRLAGQFYEHIATNMHDPLKAKALVLRQGKEEFALVFCDLVGLSLNVTTNARAIASRRSGIPVSHIVIAATHSHTGPLFDDVRRDYLHDLAIKETGHDEHEKIYYPTFLSEKLVKVIAEAKANLKPAELDSGIATQTNLAFNRRYRMKDGKVKTNPGMMNTNVVGPAGPTDPDVGILIVKDREREKAIGGLTVFAMHADTAGGNEFSADYPFYIQQTLRNFFGANYISAFGAGTCGDLNHVDVTKKIPYAGFPVSERLGSTLGKTVIEALPKLQPINHPMLAVESETLNLPVQTTTPKEVAAAKTNIAQINNPKFDFLTKVLTVRALDLGSREPNLPSEVQVFRLDADNAIVCLPGEFFVEFGLAIKKASPFKNTFVITICNDRPGYVPTLKAFAEGSYEIYNSRLKPGSGEQMAATAVKLLKKLKE